MMKVFARVMRCDCCPSGFISDLNSETFWDLIEKAERAGWVHFGNQDRCPACQGKVAERVCEGTVSGGAKEWG